ncbi:MAG: hypothetical protein ACRC7O_10445 [Fimbriiglobus sp.]
MALSFDCPCGQHLEIDDEFAGQFVVCPTCRRDVRAPGKHRPAAAPNPTDDDTDDVAAFYHDPDDPDAPIGFTDKPVAPKKSSKRPTPGAPLSEAERKELREAAAIKKVMAMGRAADREEDGGRSTALKLLLGVIAVGTAAAAGFAMMEVTGPCCAGIVVVFVIGFILRPYLSSE